MINDVTLNIDELQAKTEKARSDNAQLQSELNLLYEDRNDLLRKMGDLTRKYDTYVKTMNHERAEIAQANKKHIKLLTSKLMFSVLKNILNVRYKGALQQCQEFSDFDKVCNDRSRKIISVLANFADDQKRKYLQRWFHAVLNPAKAIR